ncbi:MAG TPA: IS110 family transposase [Pirellulales bacterium]|nr:IS110 family transposase [Pirellulales bacterium]
MPSIEVQPNVSPAVPVAVGIDTARYGHSAHFLREDRQPAIKPLDFTESSEGYAKLRAAFEKIVAREPRAHFHIRVDAAGQYATNLERFLRGLPWPKTLSIGEPERNKRYRQALFPKRKADATDSLANARFAIAERPPETPDVPAEFYQLREVVSRLEAQVRQTTRVVNQLHNLLSRVFPELATIVSDLAAGYVLTLVDKYPTAQKIAQAKPASLTAIPHLTAKKADEIQKAAKDSVASLRGSVPEALVTQLVAQIKASLAAEKSLEKLTLQAYQALPPGPHRQVETIKGIGPATAAVIVAKVVSIDRFETAADLVGYFGVFPEESSSGVDKRGKPCAPGTMEMSRRGNDLVRRYLYMACWSACKFNPAIRPLYARQMAHGKRGDVALGHCMRKMLHLVFAVWKTDRPFDPNHYPWEKAGTQEKKDENAAGHNRDMPEKQVVTAADSKVDEAQPAVNAPLTNEAPSCRAAPVQKDERVDFKALRQHVTMEQILSHLDCLADLRGAAAQRRGRCPIHADAGDRRRSFSVNLEKNVFQCFDPACGMKGNVLDLWAAVHRMPLHEAALHLAKTFQLDKGTEEKRNP